LQALEEFNGKIIREYRIANGNFIADKKTEGQRTGNRKFIWIGLMTNGNTLLATLKKAKWETKVSFRVA